jgi:dihydroxy-acid dehydratase
MPIPQKLLEQGVTDMLRISDARMSGTAFGTVVLHVSPETSIGGPLGLVETGDEIVLDAEARTLNLMVSDTELARRAAARPPEQYDTTRGYVALHRAHVMQAHLGADLDFLVGGSGDTVKRESH